MTTRHKFSLSSGLIAAIVLALAFQGHTIRLVRYQQALERKTLNEQLLQAARENERLSGLIAASEKSSLSADHLGEVLRLRGEIGVLRRTIEELSAKSKLATPTVGAEMVHPSENNEVSMDYNKLPLLGDIPVLGELFRRPSTAK